MNGESWKRYREALAGERLPVAFVDLDAFERNVDRFVEVARAAGKRLRVASKSLRCPALVARVVERAGGVVDGVMTYTAEETAFYAADGIRDLLLAYPTLQPRDAASLAEANRTASAAAVVDDAAQLRPLADAARTAGTRIPVVIDVDMSWTPAGMHVGVRRSPLRRADEVVALARAVAAESSLRFDGILGYEAQVAGVPDAAAFQRWQNPIKRAIKRRSQPAVARLRGEVTRALADAGLPARVVNGGGTGSAAWSVSDASLTEITVGSGFLAGHLFSEYRGLTVEPALFFALQAVRRPTARIVTCHGGGFVASGAAGADRLPRPVLPEGCRLLPLEGAGEVQTPVELPDDVELALGDPIFFRPAKSGELAEHCNEYLLLRGERVVERVPTYRGLGKCFLG
jgi:D-serine deaminase-like pyridoxal phosphate-dependent protein